MPIRWAVILSAGAAIAAFANMIAGPIAAIATFFTTVGALHKILD